MAGLHGDIIMQVRLASGPIPNAGLGMKYGHRDAYDTLADPVVEQRLVTKVVRMRCATVRKCPLTGIEGGSNIFTF